MKLLIKTAMSLLAFLCLAALTAGTALAQYYEDETPSVYIDINRGNVHKYGIAVADLEGLQPGDRLDENALYLPRRLSTNLDMTGLFNILDRRSFMEMNKRAGLDEAVPLDYQVWSKIGAEFLIKGAMARSGSRITLEMRLFDVGMGRKMLGKRYTGSVKDARKMINQFTNSVLETITGTPGCFGSKIVFVSGDKAAKSVMMTELGGEEAEVIAGYKGGPSTQPTLGPGDRMAWIHRNGKKWELLVDGKVISSGELHLSPAFRPDGTVAAAVSGPTSTNIQAFSGRSKRPLTAVGGIAVSPTFAPDGRMAYVSDQGGRAQIYIDGVRLTSGSKSTDPAWSPQGDLIAYVARETDICIINANGGGQLQLTGGQGVNMRPSITADGRMIVFSSNRNGREQLFVMAVNGQSPQPLLPGFAGSQRSPYCSPEMPQ